MRNDIMGSKYDKKPIYKKWWFWVLVVLVIGIVAPKNNNSTENTGNTAAVQNDDKEGKQNEGKATSNGTSLQYVVKTDDVMNGFGTEVIGEYAYIEVKKSELTNESLLEIYKKEIENKNYNWFTIKFEDGTGIVFGGCISYGDYGKIAEDGCIDGEPRAILPTYDAEGNINGFELHKYIYEKLELADEEIRSIGKEWTDATTKFKDIDEMNNNIDNLEKKYMEKYGISEDEARELLEDCEYWNLYN